MMGPFPLKIAAGDFAFTAGHRRDRLRHEERSTETVLIEAQEELEALSQRFAPVQI
jgi:hypothetical protein